MHHVSISPRARGRLAALATLAVTAPLLASYSGPADADPVSPTSLAVTGYALGGTSDAVIARNAPGLDTLTVAGISINGQGSAVSQADAGTTHLVSTAHDPANDLRAELLVSNYSNRLGDFDTRAAHRLLSSPTNREAVAQQVVDQVTSGGWDGVNVDLEALRSGDADGLVAFLQALRTDLTSDKTLTIDVSARGSESGYLDGGYQLANIAAVVDTVQVMAYDEHGPGWSGPGPVGALPWQKASMQAALQQVPAAQLDLGVAGYGYVWNRDDSGHTVTDAGARRLVKRDHATARWVAKAGEWTARLSRGRTIWWSDARSFEKRRTLASQLGVHGLAVWRVGASDTIEPAP